MEILIPHSDDIYETIRWTGLLNPGFKHTFLNFVAEYVSKHKHNLIEATDLVNVLGYNCPINRLNTLEKWIPLVPMQIPENVIREAFKGTSANDYEQAMRLCRTHNARISSAPPQNPGFASASEKPFLKTLAEIIQQKGKALTFILEDLRCELNKHGSISGPITCEWLREVLHGYGRWVGNEFSIMEILIPHSNNIHETIHWTSLLDLDFRLAFLDSLANHVRGHQHCHINVRDLADILGYIREYRRLDMLKKWIPLVSVQISEDVIHNAFKRVSDHDEAEAMRLCRMHNSQFSIQTSASNIARHLSESAPTSTIGTRESRIHQAMTASGSGDVSRAVQYAVNRAVGDQIRDTKSQPALFVDTGGVETGTYGGLDVNIKNCFSGYEIPKHMTRVAAEAVMAAVAAEFLRRATFPAHMDEEMKEAAVAAAAAEAMEEIEIEIQEEDTVVEAKPQTSSESESESKRRKREVVDLDKEEDDDDDDECKICMEESRTHVLNPCGHWCLCGECSAKVKECPICRVKIVSSIRVFKS
jgi:hypothetical protein